MIAGIQIYYGAGHGKTSAALGLAIHEASSGKSAIVIEFLKDKKRAELSFVSRLEPELKVFRFQKSSRFFDDLSDAEKQDEIMNMKNGINYARKVLMIGECDVLVLDEILGLVDRGIMSVDDIKKLISLKSDDTALILTGRVLPDELVDLADGINEIREVK